MKNFEANCHTPLDLTKALQSVVLYGCAYVSFPYAAYMATLYRQKILRYSSVPIQDFDALNYNGFEASIIGKTLIRLLMIAPVAALSFAPILLIDRKQFGQAPLGPILILITNYNLPLMIAGFYIVTLYDKAVFWCQECFNWNDY